MGDPLLSCILQTFQAPPPPPFRKKAEITREKMLKFREILLA